MSLNFDLTSIPEDVRLIDAPADDPSMGIKAGDKVMNPVTNALIWTTLVVGLGGITDATLEEFVSRVTLYQKLHGALMSSWTGDEMVPRPITREDIEANKGLTTNVSPETRAAWVKRMVTDDRGLFPHPAPRARR